MDVVEEGQLLGLDLGQLAREPLGHLIRARRRQRRRAAAGVERGERLLEVLVGAVVNGSLPPVRPQIHREAAGASADLEAAQRPRRALRLRWS